MARIRSIKPAFFTSEDTCQRSPLARLLFLGLLTEADRRGRVEDRPTQLKRRLLPDDQCDVDALLWELSAAGLIRRYEAAGAVRVIEIVKFEKHQKPHPKEAESVLPAEGKERKPNLSTAGREEVFEHPVENPSSPRRNGSGDLGSGDLGVSVPPATHTQPPQAVQGPGAFAAGSLPRDHKNHALCGKQFRLCLSYPVFGKFVTRYGGPEAAAATALEGFVNQLEAEHQAIGDYLWLENHFTAFLRTSGRLKDADRANDKPAPQNNAHDRELQAIKDGTYGR